MTNCRITSLRITRPNFFVTYRSVNLLGRKLDFDKLWTSFRQGIYLCILSVYHKSDIGPTVAVAFESSFSGSDKINLANVTRVFLLTLTCAMTWCAGCDCRRAVALRLAHSDTASSSPSRLSPSNRYSSAITQHLDVIVARWLSHSRSVLVANRTYVA